MRKTIHKWDGLWRMGRFTSLIYKWVFMFEIEMWLTSPSPPLFWQNLVIFKASTTFFSRKLAFRWDLSSALKREKNSIPLKRTNDFFAKESWPSCCEENVPSKSEIAQKLLSTTLSRSHNSIHWANLQYLLVYRGNHVL